MKNNVLFTLTNLEIINKLKENGISNFVYPLASFCVGIPRTFTIDEIKEEHSFLLINRVLDSNSIDNLAKILNNLPSNIEGIIFDDLGVLEIIKDLPIKKILYLSHFCTNYLSINEYFKYVDDIILSTDITEEEIDQIIKNTNKQVSAMVFGLVSSFYSRRTLLTSYTKHYNLDYQNTLEVTNSGKKFITFENEFGTVMYHYPYFNGLRLKQKDLHYYFYFPMFLDDKKILDLINDDIENIETDYGFLDTKTIYKIKNN